MPHVCFFMPHVCVFRATCSCRTVSDKLLINYHYIIPASVFLFRRSFGVRIHKRVPPPLGRPLWMHMVLWVLLERWHNPVRVTDGSLASSSGQQVKALAPKPQSVPQHSFVVLVIYYQTWSLIHVLYSLMNHPKPYVSKDCPVYTETARASRFLHTVNVLYVSIIKSLPATREYHGSSGSRDVWRHYDSRELFLVWPGVPRKTREHSILAR